MLLDSNSKRVKLLTNERNNSIFNVSFEYEAYILEDTVERYPSAIFSESFKRNKRFFKREKEYFIYDRSI